VRAVTRVATPGTEERLLAVARGGTAAQVEQIVRGWRYVDRQAEIRDARRQHATRGLYLYEEDGGAFVVRGRLSPEAGALFRRALDAARNALHQQAAVSAQPAGQDVSAETSRRLACDASRVVMRHDVDGRTVEVSARTRTIPPALRRALQHRDRGCRFPGCGARIAEGHHIRHWAAGGPTTLSNLPCCVGAITAPSTKKASGSNAVPRVR